MNITTRLEKLECATSPPETEIFNFILDYGGGDVEKLQFEFETEK